MSMTGQASLAFRAEDEYADAVEVLHQATAIYTREPVAEQLLDRLAWGTTEAALVDTSCGDGVFVLAALRRLLSRHTPADGSIHQRVRGWEIHPLAASQARERVRLELVAHGWTAEAALKAAAQIITTGDFLASPDTDRYDWIVGNPPYLRLCNCPSLLRMRYQRTLPRWAQADMLHAFLAKCTERLTPRGEIVLVTADRWLFNASAAELREQMGSTLRVSHLERLDVNSAFHRAKTRRAGTPPRVHPVIVHLRPGGAGRVLSRAPIYPDVWDEMPHARRMLASEAAIRVAPWLGPYGVFVVDEITAKRLPPECLVPAIDTDDIQDGVLQTPRRYAIRTNPDEQPPGSVLDHLARERHRLPPRAVRSSSWLPAESWHRLDLSQESLLVPRIAKSLRPVRIPAGVLPINHNLTIVAAGKASLDDIATMLSCEQSDRWIRARAPRLENGYLSITTSMLRDMPWFESI